MLEIHVCRNADILESYTSLDRINRGVGNWWGNQWVARWVGGFSLAPRSLSTRACIARGREGAQYPSGEGNEMGYSPSFSRFLFFLPSLVWLRIFFFWNSGFLVCTLLVPYNKNQSVDRALNNVCK